MKLEKEKRAGDSAWEEDYRQIMTNFLGEHTKCCFRVNEAFW